MLGNIFSFVAGKMLSSSGILKTVGKLAARYFGNYLESSLLGNTKHHLHISGIIDNFYNPTSVYGSPIPLIYGSARIDSSLIWSSDIRELKNSSTSNKYDFYGIKKSESIEIEYSYYLSFALAICEGEISNIGRVWVNNELVDLSNYKYTLYKGDKEQMPDPIIERDLGEGNTSAYRDLCYIVFKDLPLADFGNHLPLFSFEVFRRADKINSNTTSLESMINHMVMIPGSGEFVYDTKIQSKKYYEQGAFIKSEYINCNNEHNIANAIHSLNQLQEACPNLEWVAPVVTWLCNDLDIAKSSIYPAAEYKDPNTKTTEEWRIGNINRDNAKLVSKDKLGNPNYGGTVNDASVVRYLAELKKRGLKVLFYPMFFMDTPKKPWRGHVKGNAKDINAFFNKKDGYNNFIIHYANLLKDHIDAFIIGSEMIGITTIMDESGNFPAVNELIELARQVKKIVGDDVKVTYAADWSEYHHNSSGWYHLDPLWSSEYIDFVGIDAYFPLTNMKDSNISEEDIKKGWESGEGYDYISGANDKRHSIDSKYAWKNLRHWWENEHINPDGQKSAWIPKSKKIWFTEYGFPSIDKAPNQPNVFFDPKCSDGGVPRNSNSDTNFELQRTCIKATLDYWKDSEFLEKTFLWTWDARPYPAWPHSNFWSDGYLWEKGHWINGKLSGTSLQTVLEDLCYKSGITISNLSFQEVNQKFNGAVIQGKSTILDVIHMLRTAYFFDITIRNNVLQFKKRGIKQEGRSIGKSDLILRNPYHLIIAKKSDNELIGNIRFTYIDANDKYNRKNAIYLDDQKDLYYLTEELNLPIIMGYNEAKSIMDILIKSSKAENTLLSFRLSFHHIYLEAGDIIDLTYENQKYILRIISIEIVGIYLDLICTQEDISSYQSPKIVDIIPTQSYRAPDFIAIPHQLSLSASEYNQKNFSSFIFSNKNSDLYYSEDGVNYTKSFKNLNGKIFGQILQFKDDANDCNQLIDKNSKITIYYEKNIPNQTHEAYLGGEIIAFSNAEKLDNNKYILTTLYRNLYNSKKKEDDNKFIILNKKIAKISSKYKFLKINGNIIEIKNINFKAIVSNIQSNLDDNGLNITWIVQHIYVDDWNSQYDIPVIQYMLQIGDRNYVVNHDYSKFRQEFHMNSNIAHEVNINVV